MRHSSAKVSLAHSKPVTPAVGDKLPGDLTAVRVPTALVEVRSDREGDPGGFNVYYMFVEWGDLWPVQGRPGWLAIPPGRDTDWSQWCRWSLDSLRSGIDELIAIGVCERLPAGNLIIRGGHEVEDVDYWRPVVNDDGFDLEGPGPLA